MNPKTSKIIKTTSVTLISTALGLEIWNAYLHFNNEMLPENLNSILLLSTIALIAHGIEGLIAAFNASPRNENPLFYGIYTFFVGFVGLQELFDRPEN